MSRFFTSEGIVLNKKDLLKNDKLVIIFSKDWGKIVLIAKGVSTITSRRLPHLESGNYIKFSFARSHDAAYLQETDLIYGYSKTRNDPEKVSILYRLLFTLNSLLPENQIEEGQFSATLKNLKRLNNTKIVRYTDQDSYLIPILIEGGYVTNERSREDDFDAQKFIEELTGKKINVLTF